MTVSAAEPVTVDRLFNGRKDIDFRVASDVRHINQFGFSSEGS
jgi:hypothetical protein